MATSRARFAWWLLAVVACDGGAPQRTQVENACELAGRRVVVEGVLDADRDMRCVDRACDFSLRDNGHSIIARAKIPEGYNAFTSTSFPGAARGERITFGRHTVITGKVVADPPPCRIDIEHVTQ